MFAIVSGKEQEDVVAQSCVRQRGVTRLKNYMSREEAEELGEGFVRQLVGRTAPVPSCVDIEAIVTQVLNRPLLYESFAEADKGSMGFLSNGVRPLKVIRNHLVCSVVFPNDTVVLDRFLLKPSEVNRRRFTLAHEAGHVIAKRTCACGEGSYFHKEYDEEASYHISELQDRYNLSEWQANTLAETLLMPTFMMKQALRHFNSNRRLPVYGNAVFHPREKAILEKMAESLGVSYTALTIRLRNLGMLNHHEISEYITKDLIVGNAQ